MSRAGVVVALLGMVAIAAADAKPSKAKPAEAKQPAGSKPAPAKAEAPAEAPADEADEADEAGEPPPVQLPPHLEGPKHVELGHNTELELPAGMILYEAAQAREILTKQGNDPEGVVALVEPLEGEWTVSIDFDDVGYVEDSDANELDATELLASYREGTVQQNARRKSLGIPELTIDKWSEMPRYERAQHQLLWGLSGHDDQQDKFINFFTRVLGRAGYLSVDLIAAPEIIEAAKTQAAPILQNLKFKAGARYEDHTSSDRSAGIGLRGLVLGGAGVAVASKLGILAKILIVLKKGLIVIGAAIAGFFRWLVGRKKTVEVATDDQLPR